jgi:hypothetical protein
MSKEVINHVCSYCESPFKLSYDSDDVTSLPKFCPMCGEETLAELIDDDQGEVDFGTYEDEDPVL